MTRREAFPEVAGDVNKWRTAESTEIGLAVEQRLTILVNYGQFKIVSTERSLLDQ